MKNLLTFFWLNPLLEADFLLAALVVYRVRKRRRSGSAATFAVVQVTTIGNYDTVNEIISTVRSYDLPFPYEFWVITEPHVANHYEGADHVFHVPATFEAKSQYKARAQEYSRRIRQQRGLDRHDVKIIMLDDDSIPSRNYLANVFEADYDVCEGVLVPRVGYGRLMSHLDDVRTHSCLTVCAFWQGIGHPIWVHGEGLCLRGSAEAAVTWNFPVIASEDLMVGQNSLDVNLSWGFVWEYVQITSPWTMRDYIKQRNRWIWGNIAVLRDGLIPPLGAFLVTSRWLIGLLIEILMLGTLPFVLADMVATPDPNNIFLVSLACWFGLFAYTGWVGSASMDRGPRRRVSFRIFHTVVAAVLAPITLAASVLVQLYCLTLGPPTKFEVIAKANPAQCNHKVKS